MVKTNVWAILWVLLSCLSVHAANPSSADITQNTESILALKASIDNMTQQLAGMTESLTSVVSAISNSNGIAEKINTNVERIIPMIPAVSNVVGDTATELGRVADRIGNATELLQSKTSLAIVAETAGVGAGVIIGAAFLAWTLFHNVHKCLHNRQNSGHNDPVVPTGASPA